MRHHLHTEIDIAAPPQAVWEVLTDLDAYQEWNPLIVSSSGEVAVGSRLTNRMEPPGGRGMTIKPTVTVADEPNTFEFLGRLGIPGVFDGRHRFELHAAGDGTRLVQSEALSGILVRPMKKSLDKNAIAGFEAMNQALKARVEDRG